MFFKKNTLVALLLFLIVIIFAIISCYNENILLKNISKEGYTDISNETTESPTCGDNSAPPCFSSIVSDQLYNWDSNNYFLDDDNYILKTQVIPPVCPSCPTMLKDHDHNVSEGLANNKPSNGASNGSTNIQETTVTDINQDVNNESSTITNTSNLTNVYNDKPQPQPQQQQSQEQNKFFENKMNDLVGQLKSLKQSNSKNSDGSCPPCPPCDRCPEPAFSCEKVINYRSSNVGEYLPMPVLNDFSTIPAN